MAGGGGSQCCANPAPNTLTASARSRPSPAWPGTGELLLGWRQECVPGASEAGPGPHLAAAWWAELWARQWGRGLPGPWTPDAQVNSLPFTAARRPGPQPRARSAGAGSRAAREAPRGRDHLPGQPPWWRLAPRPGGGRLAPEHPPRPCPRGPPPLESVNKAVRLPSTRCVLACGEGTRGGEEGATGCGHTLPWVRGRGAPRLCQQLPSLGAPLFCPWKPPTYLVGLWAPQEAPGPLGQL